MNSLILQPIEQLPVYQPLNVLWQHLPEWYERKVTPDTVVVAIGYIAGKYLQDFEERDIIAWMNDGIIGKTVRQGEI